MTSQDGEPESGTRRPEPDHVVVGLGLGLPAPVDYDAGCVRGWSVMSGWDGYDIRAKLARFGCPTLIDNDVNLLTLAEHRRHWPDVRHLFYIKAGNGIGSGMVIDGRINRGVQGAAGDIGHAHLPGYGDPSADAARRVALKPSREAGL